MQSSACKKMNSIAVVFLVLGLAIALRADTWQVGDVFVCYGGGQCKVFRISGTTATFIDQISDSGSVTNPGATNGAANTNNLHFLMSDAGASSNQSKIVEYRIAHNDPLGNPLTPPHAVLTPVFDGSNSGASLNIQSIALNSAGHIFVANASPPRIVELNQAGGFLSSTLTLTSSGSNSCIDSQLASFDLSADGSTVFLTSVGGRITKFQLPLTGKSTCTTVTNIGNQGTLYDIRVVPPNSLPVTCGSATCPSLGGFLVVAKGKSSGNNICGSNSAPLSCALLLDNTGTIVKQYTISGQNNFQVLTLDPMLTDCTGGCASLPLPNPSLKAFWLAGPTSSSFFKVDIATGSSTPFGPITGVSGVQSMSIWGAEGANQPGLTALPSFTVSPPTSSNPTANTAFFKFPLPVSVDSTNELTFTGYSLTGGPMTETVTVAGFASAINPLSGRTEDNLPCTQTIPAIGSDGPKCVVWDVDASNNSSTTWAQKIFSPPGTQDNGSYVFLDEHFPIATSVGNFDGTGTYIGRSCVFSLNQAATSPEGCSYFPKLDGGGACFKDPNNITFRFNCSGLTTQQLQAMDPHLIILPLSPPLAPLPVSPLLGTGGTTNYRFDITTGTWVFNWFAMEGTFQACTFDQSSQNVQTFCVGFTDSSTCKP